MWLDLTDTISLACMSKQKKMIESKQGNNKDRKFVKTYLGWLIAYAAEKSMTSLYVVRNKLTMFKLIVKSKKRFLIKFFIIIIVCVHWFSFVFSQNLMNKLEQKRNNSFTTSWIVWKFFFVITMFAQCPDSHLIETSDGEYCGRKTLSHNGKWCPCIPFISIVWTGYIVEKKCKRILCRHRNFSFGCARWSQITKSTMYGKVTILV